jgi:hypothetical protein
MSDESSTAGAVAKLYNELRPKLFRLYPDAVIKPVINQETKKTKITIFIDGAEASIGYSGNTNIIEAQKEAAVAAFEHMGLDLVREEAETPAKVAVIDDDVVNLDDIPF